MLLCNYFYTVQNKIFLEKLSSVRLLQHYIIYWLNCQIWVRTRTSCTHCCSICLYKILTAKIELLFVKHISSVSIMHAYILITVKEDYKLNNRAVTEGYQDIKVSFINFSYFCQFLNFLTITCCTKANDVTI